MVYEGQLNESQQCTSGAEIIAVANHQILATTKVNTNGQWTLKTDNQANWIIAQCRQSAIAAVAASPSRSLQLTLPKLELLEFEAVGLEDSVGAWLDPVELDGISHELIESFFIRPNGLLDLHVTEFQFTTAGKTVSVPVQRGTYRISGGTINLHPSTTLHAIQLTGVTDLISGNYFSSDNGQVIITVNAPAKFRLHFEKIVNPSESLTIKLSP